ncbi:MAG: sigma 54-interacting transcriptional regulator, partial [Gemmatimonadota bacterium]|nr:sigma 54-interacting transcriptional regulator [Gemmatimonadota bacterium]
GRQIKSLARFDGEHFTFVDRPEKGPGVGNCFSIYEDLEGHLWFGGGNGLFRYEEQKLKRRKLAADVDAGGICSITQDQEGRFIFGYWEHYALNKRKELLASPLKIVYQQGEQRQTIFAEDNKKTPLSRIGAVLTTRNNEIYFHLTSRDSSTSVIGFARWHPQEGLTWYGVEDGLIDNHVNDLLLDRHGNLWIATLGGISCFDGRSFRSFTTKDGLPSNRIHCLFEDTRGHLWIGTDQGVALYDGRLFQTIQSPHIGPVCRILEDRDGTFWLGTIVGSIIRYRPRQTSPQIRLIRVITDQVYQKTDVCRSTVGQPVIFEYKDLSFSTHPRDMLYVYRLQGYDADWCPATRELRACYQNLPPGDYTFQVRAIDQDLNYSEPAQAQLAVKPDAHIETLSATLRGDNKVVGPSKGLRQLQTKLTEVAPADLTVLIGQSDPIRQFQTKLTEVAPSDLAVLILGETGVGKGLAARALHALSAYGKGPFIHVDCGALSQELGDSALFGREDETATSQVGKVEQAKDGTLFLDEIGDLTLDTQDKVLRLLEECTFERVGSDQTLTAQTRIVAATSRDLKTMVQAGDFREELYLRLQMFPLYIPPLREHKEDIPALVEFCKNRMAAHLGRQPASLSVEVMEMLHAYDWPGNVRELEHLIQQAVTTCKGGQIEVADLMQHGFNIVNSVLGLKGESQEREIMPLLELERSYILEVLNATNGQIKGTKGAAALLGVPPSTLYNKMRKLGIKRS